MNSVKVLEDDNRASEGVFIHEEKGNTTGLESLMSSAQRRKLADISNLQDPTKPMNRKETHQQQNMLLYSKEYAEKLQKENMTLMKALAHRNKIIELSSVEFQKLRINFQHVQEKNLQLAQAHSQMLAELNTNRDRLKAIQHELGCKNAVLMAKKIQREVKFENMLSNSVQEKFVLDAANPVKDSRLRKRQCARRQSTRFDVQEPEQTEKLPEMDKAIETTSMPVSRRRSTRLRPEEVEPCESFHERDGVREKIKRRRISSRLDSEEPEVAETSKAGDAGSLVSKESIGSRSEVVELSETRHDTKVPNGKRRVSTRRRQYQSATEMDEAIQEVAKNPSSIPSSVCEEGHEIQSRQNKPKADETLKAGDAGSLVTKESVGSRSEVGKLSESSHDTKETKGKRRVSTRRSQSQTAAETDEAIKEVAKNPSSIPSSVCEEGHEIESRQNKPIADETLMAGDAGSLVSKEYVGSRSEAVEQSESRHDTKETNKKRRVSTRRKQSQTATEPDEAIKEVEKKPCLIQSSGCEEGHEIESKHDKPEADEIEEVTRRTSVRRPSRVAAEKIQSYREVSLKVKMRRKQ